MRASAAPGDLVIDRQDAIGKGRQHASFDPSLDEPPSTGVAAGKPQRANFKFENGYARKEHDFLRHVLRPCRNVWIGSVRPPEFRNDVGVEQEHQSKSAE